MKKLLKSIRTLLFSSVLLLSLAACDRTPEERAERVVDKITSKLDLNEEQVGKLNVIKNQILKYREEHKDKKAEHEKVMTEMVLSTELDQEKIKIMLEEKTIDLNKKV